MNYQAPGFNLNLAYGLGEVNEMGRDECEERLLYLRYLLRREAEAQKAETYQLYIQKFENRLAQIKQENLKEVNL